MSLSGYFNPNQFKSALTSYAEFAQRADWRVSEKLRLYNCAKVAFDSNASETDRRRHFREIYDNLKNYWKVFRNNPDYWDADMTFDILTKDCQSCSRSSGLNLATLCDTKKNRDDVKDCLQTMAGLKKNKSGYPWVAVSKFLHFFNPALFPIYDITFIWNEICNSDFRFKRDYMAFCASHKFSPGETSYLFNYNYTLWASELLAGDEELMNVFSGWFVEQVKGHPDPQNVLPEIKAYYATAFEFVLLGAGNLERPLPVKTKGE